MGHKKRNPATRSRSSPPLPLPPTSEGSTVAQVHPIDAPNGLPTVDSLDQIIKIEAAAAVSSDASSSSYSSIKLECERALNALRRGNHTKALRLLKEACLRHENSALLFRVQGTICVKVACLIEDQNAKQRHLKNAVESARKAASLSPNSIEFAHFYANLLYEAANDNKGYEEVIQECERALTLENPVDPAKESLQEECQQKLSTPDARISHVQQELRSLIQKSNIASISTWMKNLGNGNGEEKFRLIPVRRLPEDPMEARLVPARRPNEIKKATKTPEERRKEIEVRVAAARLLQQKSDLPQLQNDDDDRTNEPSSGSSRSGERRKYANLRKVTSSADRMDQVRSYWNSMSLDKKQSLLKVSVGDLRSYFSSPKDTSVKEIISEALSFARANKTWKFWICCRCDEKFIDGELHMQHIVREHMGILSSKFQAILPNEVDTDWFEMLLNGSWKPLDLSASVKMLEDQSKCRSPMLVDNVNAGIRTDVGKEDCPTNDWCSKDAWYSSLDEGKVQSSNEESKTEGICNGNVVENRKHGNSFNFELVDNNKEFTLQSWPLSDDLERGRLLGKIRDLFQLLLKHRYLAASQLFKVIQYSMDELQSLAPGSRLLNQGLDQTPLCICFLGASQLRKVLKFLQDLCHSCGLSRYPEKNSTTDEIQSGTQEQEIRERIILSDDLSCLSLDERLLHGEITSGSYSEKSCSSAVDAFATRPSAAVDHEDLVAHDSNALLSWIFTGPSSGEQLASWTRLREEKTHHSMEIMRTLEKEFCLLQGLCERKSEHLSYEEALQVVENLCLEELKKREHAVKLASQSYETILRKRQEELVERDNDVTLASIKFELDAISNVLKEAQSLNAAQFGYEDTFSGVTSRLCDLESSGDDDWRVQDYLHQADTCIEVGIQRQKEQLSVELSKIDARMVRNVTGMQQLELKLGPCSSYDYRAVILPLAKSFMRAHLEDLVDKDATEKSDAAREAFLAELALDAKKSINKGSDPKQAQEKSKDKKKNKDYRKTKDIKASGGSEHLYHLQETAEPTCLPVVSDGESEIVGIITGQVLKQEEEEVRRKIELEEEERKLEETLEYQRRIENEAKQKHLAEQYKKASESIAVNVIEGLSVDDFKPGADEPLLHVPSGNCKPLRVPADNGSSVSWKGIALGGSHSEVISSSNSLDIEFNMSKKNFGRPDITENSEITNVSFSYHEMPHDPHTYEGCLEGKSSLSQDLAAMPIIKDAEGSALSPKSSTNSVNQRNKRSNSMSQGKVKPGLSDQGVSADGVLSSDRLMRKQGRWQNNSTKLLDGSLRPSSSGKENNSVKKMQPDVCNKEQANARDQATVPGVNLDSCPGDTGTKTLRQLHAEEVDEERFQADLQKAVLQSLDAFQARQTAPMIPKPRVLPKMFSEADDSRTSPSEAMAHKEDAFGTGLRNEVGEYNCFLNVIIQSLWHLRRFRDEFLRRSTSLHTHVGDPCVVCALYDIFTALDAASTDSQQEAVAPTSLRIALSNLYPDSNFFREAQMNDASEVLAVIFDCLHQSFTSGSGVSDVDSEESYCLGSWDCPSSACIAHTLFGMDIFERMNCYSCGVESRHLKYTSFFHNINASALRTMKIMCADSSFAELLNLVEMNHQLACDPEAGGCGKLNYIHHILSTTPHVFTIVLGWQNTCESAEDISSTLTALTTELDIGVMYRGLDPGNRHCLVSVVCYYGQHYHCFAYSHEHERWTMYDDQTVKAIGGWDDVVSMCERGHLQPQVLFFEAVN